MVRIAFKSLFARKLRLALMLVAIVFGVMFIVGTLITTAGLTKTLDNLVEDIQGDVDVTVRTRQEFGDAQDRPPVDASVLATVRATPGVAAAEGNVAAVGVVPVKPNGEPVKTQGAPLLGVNHGDAPELSQLIQKEGRPPAGRDEFNLDIDTAKNGKFVVGDQYPVSTPAGTRTFTLVGTAAFNSDGNDLVGAVLVIFDTPTAQELFNRVDKFDQISVKVAEGADPAQVAAALAQAIPAGTEAVTSDVTIQEGKDQFGQISSIFGNVLLAFGVIIVVVVAFLINNTFKIVVGQRLRELALLRALGAGGSQVVQAVIIEALLLGVVATVLGFGLGLLFAKGFTAVLKGIGFGLPSSPLTITPGAVIAAIVVGVGITLLAALAPVLKVRRIPPVAALRDDYQLPQGTHRRRLITGGAATALGVAMLLLGLFGSLDTAPLLTMLAFGAFVIFVGVNLLSPVFAVPVANAIGAPIARLRGTAGKLARDNAARNPNRTASTAAALMIGLALIATTAVVGDSLRTTFIGVLDNSVEADYFIQADSNDPTGGFSPDLAAALRTHTELGSVVEFRFTSDGIRVDGSTKDVVGTEFTNLLDHIDPKVLSGSVRDARPDSLLLHKDSAKSLGVTVGDVVETTFVDGQTVPLTVAAIFDDASILGNWVVSLEQWEAHMSRNVDGFVSVRFADGADPAAAAAAIEQETAAYPQVKAQDRTEFKESVQKRLDSFLAIITGFLGLSFVIALIGIFNTLQLSIFERTRELGLLRAVGMSRAQTRTMVRWEAVIVAVFGAVLGLVLGVLFGAAASSAIPDSIVNTISIPVGSLIGYVIIAALGGLLAAVLPARRAARLNVLDAISHE